MTGETRTKVDRVTSELPMMECRLDLPDLREQHERYRTLGRSVEHAERVPGALTVRFADDVDQTLLGRTLEIERGCCAFFTIHHDRARRSIRVGVDHPDQDPALDALAFALGTGVEDR